MEGARIRIAYFLTGLTAGNAAEYRGGAKFAGTEDILLLPAVLRRFLAPWFSASSRLLTCSGTSGRCSGWQSNALQTSRRLLLRQRQPLVDLSILAPLLRSALCLFTRSVRVASFFFSPIVSEVAHGFTLEVLLQQRQVHLGPLYDCNDLRRVVAVGILLRFGANSVTFSRTLEIGTCTELCAQRADWKSDYWEIHPGIQISRMSTIVLASPSARWLDRGHHIPAPTAMIRRSFWISIPTVSIFWDFGSLHHRVGGPPGCEPREGLTVSERRFPGASALGASFTTSSANYPLSVPPTGSQLPDVLWTVYEMADPVCSDGFNS